MEFDWKIRFCDEWCDKFVDMCMKLLKKSDKSIIESTIKNFYDNRNLSHNGMRNIYQNIIIRNKDLMSKYREYFGKMLTKYQINNFYFNEIYDDIMLSPIYINCQEITLDRILSHPEINWDYNIIFSLSTITLKNIEDIVNGLVVTRDDKKIEVNWKFVSKNPNLTYQFIEKYIDNIDVDKLFGNSCLTLKIVELFVKKYGINYILNTVKLGNLLRNEVTDICDIIIYIAQNSNGRNPLDSVHFSYWSFSKNKYLKKSFIDLSYNKPWDWNSLCNKSLLSLKYIKNYILNRSDYGGLLFRHPNYTIEMYKNYIKSENYKIDADFGDFMLNNSIKIDELLSEPEIDIRWHILSQNSNIRWKHVFDNFDKVEYISISRNKMSYPYTSHVKKCKHIFLYRIMKMEYRCNRYAKNWLFVNLM